MKNKLLHGASFLPAIFVMGLIYSFSASTGGDSGSLSLKICTVLVNLFSGDISQVELLARAELLQLPIRKLAHFSIYALLCLTLLGALSYNGIKGKRLFILAVVLSALYAGSDEFHQTFVDGRCGSIVDVGIDTLGAIFSSFVWHLVSIRRK